VPYVDSVFTSSHLIDAHLWKRILFTQQYIL